MKNFAIIGVSGYIEPRHLKAIKDTNNNLIAALDTYDGVGVIDSFFPETDFFIQTEIFDRHLEKIRFNKGIKLDYISICTPNYLHDSHIRIAFRRGANAICEKPLVLNPWNLDALKKMENESGQKVWNILQLRLHKTIINLKNKIDNAPKNKIFDVDLTYITSRGKWYYVSWKGDKYKSGGISTNIGIHFFDMLQWIFGDLKRNIIHVKSHDRASGYLEFEKARVRWFLSINSDLLPEDIKAKGQRTYRSILINGDELEFSDGFNELHTKSYQEILNGNGFGIEECRKSIEIAHEIRNLDTVKLAGDYHPFAKKGLVSHPFKSK